MPVPLMCETSRCRQQSKSVVKILLVLLQFATVRGAILEVGPGESIQEAVNASAAGDTVLLHNGEYAESVVLSSHPLTFGSMYILTNDTNDVSHTIWRPSGDLPDTSSCLIVSDIMQGTPIVIGLSFRDGQGTIGRDTNEPAGGAILIERSNMHVVSCKFKNSVSTYGGGVAAFGGELWSPQGHLQVQDCRFDSCSSLGWGGGVYANTCSLTVMSCSFADNSSLGDGGGLIALDCISLVSESNFRRCTGATGGVLFAGRSSRVTGCSFEDNSSLPPLYWATHYSHGEGTHVVEGCYFGASVSLSRGFNFCCSGDTILFIGNVVEQIVATVPFGTGNFVISGVRGEFAYNIVRDNRTRGEQLFPVGGTTIDIHHNYFVSNVSDFPERPSVLKIGENPRQTFHDNAIVGNSGQTIGYTSDPGTIDARYNWWGHESGPFHPTLNPGGEGDTLLSDSVFFAPWLQTPPDTSNWVRERSISFPASWQILNVYPNPFNSELSIAIAGVMGASFSLKLYDTLGREVATLQEGRGYGSMILYTAPPSLAAGVYFLRAHEGSHSTIRKIVFLK